MGYFTSTSYLEGGTLIFHWILCSEEKCNADPFSRADPVNAITWKIFSPVSRDPGIAIPGFRLPGLAWLSCNREVDFCCV